MDAHLQAVEELQVLSQQVKELCSETIWLARTTRYLITSADAGGWEHKEVMLVGVGAYKEGGQDSAAPVFKRTVLGKYCESCAHIEMVDRVEQVPVETFTSALYRGAPRALRCRRAGVRGSAVSAAWFVLPNAGAGLQTNGSRRGLGAVSPC